MNHNNILLPYINHYQSRYATVHMYDVVEARATVSVELDI